MIVKVINGENAQYFNGAKVEKDIVTEEQVKSLKDSVLDNVIILEKKDPKFRIANKVKYTMFVTKDDNGNATNFILTLGCKVYIMNDDGKTIDKYDGVHIEYEKK